MRVKILNIMNKLPEQKKTIFSTMGVTFCVLFFDFFFFVGDKVVDTKLKTATSIASFNIFFITFIFAAYGLPNQHLNKKGP